VNVTEPSSTMPSCSFSWLCSGSSESGSTSTTAKVRRSPCAARVTKPSRIACGGMAPRSSNVPLVLGGATETSDCPGAPSLGFDLAVAGRRRRDELGQQVLGRVGHRFDRALERRFVGLRRLVHAAHLADVL